MKKILLAAAAVVLTTVGVNAQSFGIKGGYNYGSLKGESVEKFNLSGNHGFYVGVLAEVPFSDMFSVQPELIYTRKGGKYENSLLGNKLNGNINMDYVSIPVLAKINITEMFSLLGGPQFGFLVNSPELQTSVGSTNTTNKLDKKAFGSFDFGVGVGASVNFPQGFFVEARYTHGLTNVFDKENRSLVDSHISNDNSFKNAVISVGAGYKF